MVRYLLRPQLCAARDAAPGGHRLQVGRGRRPGDRRRSSCITDHGEQRARHGVASRSSSTCRVAPTASTRFRSSTRTRRSSQNELGTLLELGSGAPRGGRRRGRARRGHRRSTHRSCIVDERTNTLLLAGHAGGIPARTRRSSSVSTSLSRSRAAPRCTSISSAARSPTSSRRRSTSRSRRSKARASRASATARRAAAGDAAAIRQLEGPVRIIGDKPTNKLIVMSSGRDFLALREVISRARYAAPPGLHRGDDPRGPAGNGLAARHELARRLLGSAKRLAARRRRADAGSASTTNMASLAAARAASIGGLVGKTLETPSPVSARAFRRTQCCSRRSPTRPARTSCRRMPSIIASTTSRRSTRSARTSRTSRASCRRSARGEPDELARRTSSASRCARARDQAAHLDRRLGPASRSSTTPKDLGETERRARPDLEHAQLRDPRARARSADDR